jgi:hypothetical protein
MGIIYIPIHKQERIIMKTVKLPQGTLSIDANEFLIIDDKKNEPQYKAVSDFVGGMVEVVQFPNGDLLLLNEEGKLMGLPVNEEASQLWKDTFDNDNYVTGRKDFVVGPAILIKKDALNTWAN